MKGALAVALVLALVAPGCVLNASTQQPRPTTLPPVTQPPRTILPTPAPATPAASVPKVAAVFFRASIATDDATGAYEPEVDFLAPDGSPGAALGTIDVQYADAQGKVLYASEVPVKLASANASWSDAYASFQKTTTMDRTQGLAVHLTFTPSSGDAFPPIDITTPAVSAVRATLGDLVRVTVDAAGWSCLRSGAYVACDRAASATAKATRVDVVLEATGLGTAPLDLSGYDLRLLTREGATTDRVAGSAPPLRLAPGETDTWNASFPAQPGSTPTDLILSPTCCHSPQLLAPLANVGSSPLAPAPSTSAPAPANSTTNATTPTRASNLTVETTKGTFVIALDAADAPQTVAHVAALAASHFYDGIPFHRYVPGFVIQGGDPNCRDDGLSSSLCGRGGSGTTVPLETSPNATHVYGAVGLARGSNLSSGDSQFYVVNNATGDHGLDGDYTVFGQVVAGMDVVMQLRVGDVIERVTAN